MKHPLGQLTEEVRTIRRLSYADIAKLSADADGNEMSRSRIHQLETRPLRDLPDRKTIFALARGLGVPPSVVMDRCQRPRLGLVPRRRHGQHTFPHLGCSCP